MTSIDLYTKDAVDQIFESILPSTSGASEGQVLKLDANLEPYWG